MTIAKAHDMQTITIAFAHGEDQLEWVACRLVRVWLNCDVLKLLKTLQTTWHSPEMSSICHRCPIKCYLWIVFEAKLILILGESEFWGKFH